MKKAHRALGTALLLMFAAFLGWFMMASLLRKEPAEAFKPRVLTSDAALYGVTFSNHSDGWAVGRFGLILRSDDGGKSWKKQPSGTMLALTAVSAAGPEHAFAVGSAGVLLATSDGGHTWQRQTSGTQNHLLDVQALNPADAYVVGAFGTMLSTTDGGRSWVKHSLPWNDLIPTIIKNAGPVAPNLNSVFFVSKTEGWVVGEFGLILHTEDGGKTWVSQRYGSDLPQLAAIAFNGPLKGFAAGQEGALLRTTDGGQHWIPVDIGTKHGLYALSLEGSRGIVAGNGVVFLTDDDGSTWRPMKSAPENVALSAIATLGDGAVAVGPAPTILPIEFDNHN
jgi:photosystem II stability/assembly factor-like uncharacterized protein